jgi:hypothetical protein
LIGVNLWSYYILSGLEFITLLDPPTSEASCNNNNYTTPCIGDWPET